MTLASIFTITLFFDAFSELKEQDDFDDIVDKLIRHAHRNKVSVQEPDYDSIRPCFAWAPVDIIKQTFAATTQYACNTYHLPFCWHYCSKFPALNVDQCHEAVATDTVFSDTPAIDNGATMAQIFIGHETYVADVYGMKSMAQFTSTLEDNIRKRGAMSKLISDRAEVEISQKAHDILCAYAIDDWQSEPYHQHQNYAES